VYCDFFGIHILFLNFLRHQTMDKVQKYNSFNSITNIHEDRTASEEYVSFKMQLAVILISNKRKSSLI